MFECILPIPPSVNGLFSTNWKTKRRFTSKSYEEWQAEAEQAFNRQNIQIEKFTGRLRVHYGFSFKTKRKCDLDNFPKAINDFLTKRGVIGDDSQFDQMSMNRLSGNTGLVFVSVEEIA